MVAVASKSNFTSHLIHHFSVGDRKAGKAYPLDGLLTLPDGEGHYLYNLRIIPTVEKFLYGAPAYNYEFAFQESLHKVRYFLIKMEGWVMCLSLWTGLVVCVTPQNPSQGSNPKSTSTTTYINTPTHPKPITPPHPTPPNTRASASPRG